MISSATTVAFLLLCVSCLSLVVADEEEHEEWREVSFGEACFAGLNVTCNPAEMLICVKGKCECEPSSLWDEGHNTCGPLNHETTHPMSWGQIALIVGFSLTVVVMIGAFIVRKWYKDRALKPSLDERRKSVLMEAQRGDIPMKQRKFSQHFA